MTQAEVSEAVEEVWELFRETARENRKTAQELRELFQETDLRFQETARESRKTDRKIKELGKQIGGLGEKFGGFTEGMAFPSMKRILMDRFGVACVSARVLVRRNGDEFEADVLGYSDGQVYLMEVKSNLKNRHVDGMLRNMERFPKFFTEHSDKTLYGIMAAVDTNGHVRRKVTDAGIYLAIIQDDTFTIKVPEGFRPRRFNDEVKDEG